MIEKCEPCAASSSLSGNETTNLAILSGSDVRIVPISSSLRFKTESGKIPRRVITRRIDWLAVEFKPF